MEKVILKYVRTMVTGVLIVSLLSCASTTTIQALNSKGEVDKDVKFMWRANIKEMGKFSILT